MQKLLSRFLHSLVSLVIVFALLQWSPLLYGKTVFTNTESQQNQSKSYRGTLTIVNLSYSTESKYDCSDPEVWAALKNHIDGFKYEYRRYMLNFLSALDSGHNITLRYKGYSAFDCYASYSGLPNGFSCLTAEENSKIFKKSRSALKQMVGGHITNIETQIIAAVYEMAQFYYYPKPKVDERVFSVNSGDSKFKNKDYWGAIEDYSKAIDAGLKNYDVYFKRGKAYHAMEFYNNAIDDYTQALSFEKKEEAYLNRGLCKIEVGDSTCIDDLMAGGTKGKAVARELGVSDNPSGWQGTNPSARYSSSGTGFIIDPKGYIATNYHVVDGAKGIDVYITSNGKTIAYAATPVVVDKANDLAIIKINDSKFKNTSSVPYTIGAGTKDVGTSVFAMGYPELSYLGEEIKVTDGIISSKTGYQGDITTYQISAPIQHGNSGGPLFDKNGYLVGITNAGVTSLQNVGYAIKVSYLNNLIDASPETINLPKSNQLSGLSLTEKIKKLSPFVVIIKIYEQGTSPANTGTSTSGVSSGGTSSSGGKIVTVSNNMLETDSHKFQVLSVELLSTTTKVNVRCFPKSTRTAIWNEKDDYIEEAETGKKYFITESTIGVYEANTTTYQPGMKVLYDMSAYDFTKQFPPLPSSVKVINIPSNHLFNLKIR